jgi:sugar lactone lactonase YvrE
MIPHIEDHYYPSWKVCNRTPLELGEGPRMLPDGRVVAVDILRGQLWQMDPATPEGAVLLQVLPVSLGAVAPISGSDTALLAAAGDGIAILDGGALTWLVKPGPGTLSPTDPPAPAVRMNDAVCDPHGRFWAGTMALDASPGAGALHRVNIDGSISTVLSGLTIPNGPAFTADGSVMYLADSAAGTITRFAVDPCDGALGAAQAFAAVAGGSPDGMIMDTEDHLWVAIWGAARVHRYRPDGSIERILHVPAQQPTSICFTGDTMSTLMVTTASIGLPTPGDFDGLILSADVGIRGLPTPSARITTIPQGAPPAARNSFLFSYLPKHRHLGFTRPG